MYGANDRALQKALSYERVGLSWKTCNIYKYLGARTEGNPSIGDIQDPVLMEVRDRAYEVTPVSINVWYEPLPEKSFDFSKFGIIDPIGNEQLFKFHVNSFENDALGRYIITGDVIQVPFLTQDGNLSYWEVTDVDRKSEFENFYVVVTAVPLSVRQETAEISNIPNTESVMDTIKSDNDVEGSAEVTQEGLDVGNLELDELDDPNPPAYDPRDDDKGDFLDNPDGKVF